MKTPDWSGTFDRISGPEPDPLAGVQYTGNVETDAASELAALESAFVSRRKQEDKRFRDATDSEYWIALCFNNRSEKNAFLAAVEQGVPLGGDKYLNGLEFARRLNIEIKE